MRQRSLHRRLYPSYLIVAFVCILASALYASHALRSLYMAETLADLEARARMVGGIVSSPLSPADRTRIDAICDDLGRRSSTRITVILPSGLVVGDSEKDPVEMDNHADRPEIRRALAGRIGNSIRYSYTVKKMMIYVAVPLKQDDTIVGVVRTSVPLTSLTAAVRRVYVRIAIVGICVALLAAGVSWVVSRRIARPLEEVRNAAERMMRGDMSVRVPHSGIEEADALADALNGLAAELSRRIRALQVQQDELEAILRSMTDGIVAVGADGRITNINRAAANIIGCSSGDAIGRNAFEVIRHPDLQRILNDVRNGLPRIESEIALHEPTEKYIRAYAVPLAGPGATVAGAVLVLNDVTPLKRLDRIRRDFVANVSHELKTPITAVKGYIETLLDGAMEEDPQSAREFLETAARHADRLDTIIRDLLLLARIEQGGDVPLERGRLRDVVLRAIESCSSKAARRDLTVLAECPDSIEIEMKAPLLEQALVNLLDNAVKYSEPGSRVLVRVAESDEYVTIEVEDEGCGIPPEHLPRIFERFYRVDKARSRELGGTGLGLSIVKHIAQAHRGTVTVESTPGDGSAFSIRLPKT